jgi:hypothetical protein
LWESSEAPSTKTTSGFTPESTAESKGSKGDSIGKGKGDLIGKGKGDLKGKDNCVEKKAA